MNELDNILRAMRCDAKALRYLVRTGSHVYGTAHAGSDRDYVAVLVDRAARRDLVRAAALNVVVFGADAFQASLDEQNVFALEAFFAPTEHVLVAARPTFRWKLAKAALAASAAERSDGDYAKAAKRFDDEPEVSRKRVYHALRVAEFARQIAATGRINDFGAAAGWFRALRESSAGWDEIDEQYGPLRQQLLSQIG